jgi:hypothetical protein
MYIYIYIYIHIAIEGQIEESEEPEESEQSKEEEHGDLSEYTVRRKGMVMRVRGHETHESDERIGVEE